jgi:2'-5' RNA ligase
MIPVTRCSIWLMPTGKINTELIQMISQISLPFAAPTFPPHVTLLGDLYGNENELASLMQQFAVSIQPFLLTLTTVDALNEYFRCLFLRVEETPALLEADRAARKLFHREQDPKLLPHLSLLYGNFNGETKKQIIGAIGRKFNRSFMVNQLHLYSTTGEPRNWYRIQRFTLEGREEASRD